jgi:hypothetical protein
MTATPEIQVSVRMRRMWLVKAAAWIDVHILRSHSAWATNRAFRLASYQWRIGRGRWRTERLSDRFEVTF